MPKNIVIILCEGHHDIAFLYRVLKSDGYASYTSKIKDFPTPLNKFLLSEIAAINIEELKIEEIRNRLIPSELLTKGDNLLLFYSVGGDSKIALRQTLLKTIKAIVPSEHDALEVLKDTTISVLYFLDADTKGIAKRLREVNEELNQIHQNNQDSIEENRSFLTLDNIKYGAFIFSLPETDMGNLEDYVVPLMRSGNEDIFEIAESFISMHDSTKLFAGKTTKNASGSTVKVGGVKYDSKKSLIGVVGQLQKSGKSNVVCIRESDYLDIEKITESEQCKIIIEFFNQAMI